MPPTPLIDQNGRPVTLQSFRGKYVVLAQFLTLCQDECPITTGAFQDMQQAVQQAGLGGQVAFVEATVDPGRDTPARLRAYQSEFGADWTLLTGTPAHIAALWKHFGIYYQKVPEDKPAGIDWWTHQPLTYDVDHTNGFILIDRSGNERFLSQELPLLHGQLSATSRACSMTKASTTSTTASPVPATPFRRPWRPCRGWWATTSRWRISGLDGAITPGAGRTRVRADNSAGLTGGCQTDCGI